MSKEYPAVIPLEKRLEKNEENLFAELEPPCGQDLDPEGLILCGRTPAGREAMLLIGADRCTFIGNAEDYNAARNSRCPARRCCYG